MSSLFWQLVLRLGGAAMLVLLVVGGMSLTGCSTTSSKAPPLPDSTMRKMLVEIHIATGRQETAPPLPRGLADSIYARHGIDSTAFDQALRYYSRHPARLAPIYNGVLDTLNALRRPNPDTADDPNGDPR